MGNGQVTTFRTELKKLLFLVILITIIYSVIEYNSFSKSEKYDKLDVFSSSIDLRKVNIKKEFNRAFSSNHILSKLKDSEDKIFSSYPNSDK